MKICYGRKTQARKAAQQRATLKTLAHERESRHGIHEEASAMANMNRNHKNVIYNLNNIYTIIKKSERAKRVAWRGSGKGYRLGSK